MFGSNRVQSLESQVRDLKDKLDREMREKNDLSQQLQSARNKISDLEKQLVSTDLEQLKEEARQSRAEYEGLKELYSKKIQAFDDDKEEKEQAFARQAALERYNLDNEIKNNRQSNEEFVSSTVRTFSESYNYYLNQIKLLMDALGKVASSTGEALFSQENEDLKASFGLRMAEELRSGMDTLKQEDGDLLLIGNQEAAVSEESLDTMEEDVSELEALDAAPDVSEQAEEAEVEAVEPLEESNEEQNA